jgi:hypothetical protein
LLLSLPLLPLLLAVAVADADADAVAEALAIADDAIVHIVDSGRINEITTVGMQDYTTPEIY